MKNDWGDVIAREAKAWAGEWYREGVSAQCMNWVREVLHRVGHPYASQATKEPVDGHDPGLGFANSLAGRDLGDLVIEKAELEPGDVLFWNNTYGAWGPGTITHVGIYVGDGEFVHRPTKSRPVERIRLAGFWSSRFRCALRVPQERDTAAAEDLNGETDLSSDFSAKVFLRPDKSSMVVLERLEPGEYELATPAAGWPVRLVRRDGS